MRRPGADCVVVVMKRSNSRGAKDAGHRRHAESTGNRRNSAIWRKAAAFMDGTSRMNREIHVRFCERLEVQLLGPTRQSPKTRANEAPGRDLRLPDDLD